jgi:hypothetical protein
LAHLKRAQFDIKHREVLESTTWARRSRQCNDLVLLNEPMEHNLGDAAIMVGGDLERGGFRKNSADGVDFN